MQDLKERFWGLTEQNAEYLDLSVAKEGGNIGGAPHRRFWNSYHSLTATPLPRPKC
jgi:hypothetical protein